nr:MAG TPA: hypothetical protein [Bacteriophage sp.]
MFFHFQNRVRRFFHKNSRLPYAIYFCIEIIIHRLLLLSGMCIFYYQQFAAN